MGTGDPLGETATSGATPTSGAARTDGFRAGDQLGRYVIERVLGAGGMGLVYAAHDPDLDRRVAIKVLRGDAAEESRVRLLREARAMAKVSHPNVITVYEVGTASGVDFVAMELLEGGNLGEWLRAERRDHDEVLRRFRAAGAGLAAAHARGLVHRDFKPANVLLGRDGEVVVTDFGLARGFDGDAVASTAPAVAAEAAPVPAIALDDTHAASTATSRSQPGDLSATLTRTGALLGTPAYMAPEQFACGHVGPAADQFAFAVALWEGLTGARPFRGTTIDELRQAITAASPDLAVLPRAVRPILARALAREAERRYPNMRALLAALDRRVAWPRRVAIGGAIAAAVAVGAVVAIGDGRTSPAPAAAPTARCPLADTDLATVWSPTARAGLDRRFATQAEWSVIAGKLDAFVVEWDRERDQACVATDAVAPGRLACLAGMRDDLSAVLSVLSVAPAAALSRAAHAEFLSRPEACRSGRRAAQAPLPADPRLRDQLSALMADATQAQLLLLVAPKEQAVAKADAALSRARELAAAYPPALVAGLQVKAAILHALDDCAAATPLYEDAATAAEAASVDGARAMARIGILECAITTSSDLALIARLADQARAAIQRAGDDPQLGAALDSTLATLEASTGDLDRAIELLASARERFVRLEDWRRAALTATNEASYRMLRDGIDQREPALALYRDALAWNTRYYGADHVTVAQTRVAYALFLIDSDPDGARAELAQAMAVLPREPLPADAVEVSGRVVDASGHPVAGAKVVASAGLYALFDGTPVSVFGSSPSETQTAADGRFALRAAKDALVMALRDGERSQVHAGGRDQVLRLEPGRDVTATVTSTAATGPTPDDRTVRAARRAQVLSVIALVRNGNHSYAAWGRSHDGVHTFTGLPPGRATAMALALSPMNDRIIELRPLDLRAAKPPPLAIAFPLSGAAIDLIVRADRGRIPSAQVLVFPGRLRTLPRTTHELVPMFFSQRRIHSSMAVAVAPPTHTAVGTASYRPGDIHARLSAVPPGPATVCVTPYAGDVGDPTYLKTLSDGVPYELRCQYITVGDQPLQAIVVEAPPMKNAP